MTRVLAVEHLRTMLLLVLGGFPLFGVGMWVAMTAAVGDDAQPGFKAMIAWIVFAAVALGIGLALFLMFSMMKPGRFVRDLESLEAGDSWATWSYDEAQWAEAKRIEGKRLRTSFIGAAGVAGLGLIVLIFAPVPGFVLVAIAALLVLIIWLGGSGRRGAGARTGEVRIGPRGVLRRPGGYTAFMAGGPLTKVEVREGTPARLVFTCQVRGRYGSSYDHPTVDLVVPPGREEEARALVGRFDIG